MSRRILFSCFIVFLWSKSNMLGQVQQCGVTLNHQNQWLELYEEELRNKGEHFSRSNDIVSVPVTIHLTARDNGVGRVKVQTALEVLCELNESYLSSDIKFHLSEKGITFINDDGIFNNSDFTVNKLAMQSLKSTDAINVFVVNRVGGNNVVGYYDYENDWVVVQKNAFVANNKTLAHEIGHFFSLLHPHFGWDTQPWNPSVHMSPVAEISPDGVTLTELANGDNCSDAGDKLCDTAPDYNFGIFWQGDCVYGELVFDTNGEAVDPDESLIMSYFSDDCRERFSDEQISVMHENIDHESRNYLDTMVNNPIDSIFNEIVQISPTGSVSLTADSLYFEWDQPTKGDYFYLEYDRSPTFSLDPKGIMTENNFAWIKNDWLLNTNYYWRVLTWNDTYFCHENLGYEQFSLDVSSVVPNEKSEYIQLRFEENRIFITYDIDQSKEIVISVYQINGQQLFEQSVWLNKAFHLKSFDGPQLYTGLFFVSISEKDKIIESSIVSKL